MSNTHHHGNKQKQRRFGDSWRWLQSTPHWWHLLFHHRPARRAERDLLKKVEKGEEPTEWPDRKKPENYYW